MRDAKRVYQFGPFSLDVDRRVLLRAGQVVPLTSKAFQTLLALVQNHSRVMDKDELLKLIWPDTVVEERNLPVNISTLRKALGESPEAHDYIVTIPGRGYQFVAPLRELGGSGTGEDENTGTANSTGIPPGNSSGAAQAISWLGRRQTGICAGLLGIAVIAFALGRYSRSPPQRLMGVRAITNFAGVERQPAFSPDGRSVAFVSNHEGQHDIYVGLLSGGRLVRVTNDPNVEARPRWSSDGSKLLYAWLNESGLWDAWVIPALGGVARKLVNNAVDPVWSPNGRSVVYADLATGGISMYDLGSRQSHVVTRPELLARHRQPSFSPDGRRLAFVRRVNGPFGELAIAEVGTGEWRALTDEGVFVGSPAWSPDGRNVYFASGRGGAINLWRQDARGGAPEQITVGPGDDADLDVNADGSRILFSTYRININLEETVLNHAGESARRWLTSDPGRGELAPVWSRDGKRIAYFTNRRAGENEAVWVMDADGGNPMAVAEDDRVNIGPRWLRDGQSLVYTSRAGGAGFLARSLELRRIQLTAGRPQRVPFAIGELFDPGLPAGLGDIGPQDQVLLRKADGSVQIFDLTTNRIATLKDVKGTDFQWRSDGRRFAAIVGPTHQTDPSSGVWVYDLEGKRHQVFHGWVASFRWAGVNELLVLEGKPDLNASLWRVRLDDSPKVRVDSMPLIYSFWHIVLTTRFDIHPDGKRLASEGVELHQADISLIEGLR